MVQAAHPNRLNAGAAPYNYGASAVPSLCAVSTIQPRYCASGVTPVRPPQPAASFGPVDQLTKPSTAGGDACEVRNAGAPESPAHAPRPGLSPLLAGSNNLICNEPGRPVTTRLAARAVPPVLPSPRTVTP